MSDVTGIERTLVLLKPDAVARGLVGQVLARFEAALLKIVATKMVWMDADLTKQHYFDLEERFGPKVYASMSTFMQTSPVIALVLDSGWAAIAGTVRQWLVASPRRLALIGGTGGLVMIGLGVSIAATGRKD